MDTFGRMYEQFKVQGRELADRVSELIHEGNVRRIIVRDERGNTFMEIPLTVAAVGVIAAPVLAAVAALATVISKFDIVVERSTPPSGSNPGGATEDNVNMADTLPQHMDDRGTKAEDIAGTGQHDSLGG